MTDTLKLVALAAAVLAPVGAFLLGDHRGYERAELETEARLTAATIEASEEITDAAERARFLRRQCIAGGGVYVFGPSGGCESGSAD
ncbi:hypothetical protein ABWH92_12450 [Ahrensia marina]|uniref:hypothetical protein n=1 Tax=Ahrensia marina TaxID=1514904 RepID=UPI0035CEA1CA